MKKLAFLDLETTSLDERHGDLWEIGLIMRDLRQPIRTDIEHWWQVRPDLTLADPNALKVGRYYERCRVRRSPIGAGRKLSPAINLGSPWIHEYTGEPRQRATGTCRPAPEASPPRSPESWTVPPSSPTTRPTTGSSWTSSCGPTGSSSPPTTA
ncbi:hypothetical protein ACFQ0B_65335 [Nonomuraea thailandensis]